MAHFNINLFKTNIENYGYLNTNKFGVFVMPPPILQNESISNQGTPTTTSETANMMNFRVESISAPGVSIIAMDYNRYGVGPTQKQPYSAQFNEITLSIISDGYGNIWQFWHSWLKSIFDFTGTLNAPNSYQASGLPMYSTEYKDNYSTTVELVIYDQYGNAIQTIDMFNAFPMSIQPVQLSWGNQNDLLKLNIQLTFKEYTITGVGIDQSRQLALNNISPSSTLTRNIQP